MKGLPDGGVGWSVHYAIFSRGGVTPAALAELRKFDGISVDLGMLDKYLAA
jgi:hypothetical protein